MKYRLASIVVVLMVSTLSGQSTPKKKPLPDTKTVKAWFGVKTRYPKAEEAKRLALTKGHRFKGQVVSQVEKASPAATAGIRVGNVILSLDKNDLYSFDDIRDFVATSKPGRNVTVRLRKGRSQKDVDVLLTFGKLTPISGEVKNSTFAWDYASLAQLKGALSRAKKERKNVLVGISGAET